MILVLQPVYLRFQLVGFMLLQHILIPSRYLFHFLDARMAKPVPSHCDVRHDVIFVERFKENGFYLVRKVIVWKLHAIYFVVALQSIYDVNQTGVVQLAVADVEPSELLACSRVSYDIGEIGDGFISNKVLAAQQIADLCLRKYFA